MKFTTITLVLATTSLSVVSRYNVRQIGALNTKEYTVYLEIPRGKNAKMEVSKKKGELKYIADIDPWHGYPWSYVAIIDISTESGFPGQVRQVKLLGGLLMIDDNTTDWKKGFYKVPHQGDGENEFGFNGKFQNKQAIQNLMIETHDYWNLLINDTMKAEDDIDLCNLSVQGSIHLVKVDSNEIKHVPKADPKPDAKIKKMKDTEV
ncbi:hypothetical protein INT45_014272 [Circinella minor]|uniref:inorganic diphosphatase n=1 Tax=Circinella minor TaxID=1195481 RepID=A0A8H7SED9_9FUNG|nr:hypothetical protein INT45_014272 [Circinella minor]